MGSPTGLLGNGQRPNCPTLTESERFKYWVRFPHPRKGLAIWGSGDNDNSASPRVQGLARLRFRLAHTVR